jgi:ankyrin repeat protein
MLWVIDLVLIWWKADLRWWTEYCAQEKQAEWKRGWSRGYDSGYDSGSKAEVRRDIVAHIELTRTLLTEKSCDGELLFHLACRESDGGKRASVLLDVSPTLTIEQLNAKDDKGMLGIHHAARSGDLGTVEVILAKAAKAIGGGQILNASDNKGSLPIHYAVYARKADVIECMVKAGSTQQLTTLNKDGDTPLDIALKFERYMPKELIFALLAAGTVEKQVAAIQSDEQLLRRLMGYLAMHPMYAKWPSLKSAITSLLARGIRTPCSNLWSSSTFDKDMVTALNSVIQEICADSLLYNRVNEAILLNITYSRN